MNYIEKQIQKFDKAQRKHSSLGFITAVIKKYGDDEAGYQAALLTYYGFLSIFPFLLMVTTFLKLVFRNNAHLQDKVINNLSQYVPILGDELQKNVHSLPKQGISLFVALLVILYGSRGVAAALRYVLNHIWQIPRRKVPGFPQSAVNNFKIILLGGVGLISATLFSTFAASLGHEEVFRILSSAVSFLILLLVLYAMFRVATFKKVGKRNLLFSAVIAAVGLQILQSVGGYIITHQLRHLNSLYGVFAIVLGLMFWIYLQSQVILYAVEISAVRAMKLWPRGIDSNRPTAADNLAYELYAKRDRFSH